jgi:hypothetical protein
LEIPISIFVRFPTRTGLLGKFNDDAAKRKYLLIEPEAKKDMGILLAHKIFAIEMMQCILSILKHKVNVRHRCVETRVTLAFSNSTNPKPDPF